MGQKTSILNSELAVKILSAIASRTDGSYSTNLADELDKTQPSISRILTELHTIEFIEKGKREKAQYYTINYQKVSEYWFQQIREKLEEENKTQELEKLDQNSEKLKELASCFFQNFLESHNSSGMPVSRLLFDGFAYSIGHIILKRDNILEENSFLEPALEGLKIYSQQKNFCGDICGSMTKSVDEILK